VCISWFLATQSEGKAWGLAQSRLNWQETDSHHSVMAKSENSGRIFERGGFAGRTERGDKFMCTVRLKLINFINAKSKLQQETSKPI
jgi:hypothetical protein